MPGKGVQLHHIDGDPGNNASQNIAVLCFQCHHETQLTGGFGRQLNALTVARYRDIWLAEVEHRRASAIHLEEPATVAEAAELLERYTTTFCGTHIRSNELVPFDCRLDNTTMSSADVPDLLQTEPLNLLLLGPSGCGKTCLSLQTAVTYASRGVPIFFPVKHYSGRLDSDVDREVQLLDAPSAARLLSAARKLRRPTLLIVDGHNECDVDLSESLAVELAAWKRRYSTNLLITSQTKPERSDLLDLRTVEVLPANLPGSLATGLLGDVALLGMAGVLSEAERETLGRAIESVPSSHGIRRSFAYLDALEFLGALKDAEEEHVSVAREELQRCLANRDDKESHDSAYDLYTRQFDHPYNGAYCIAFNELVSGPGTRAISAMKLIEQREEG